ncbi:polyprenyl synthetase family protein [Caldivirga maquilingensis]|uniref:Polyprenyl synthetase n=1 Tax=Caldivirga maquilingensis (strain ATCC 700844 / DSM 13496 / JCM 10307 / IC-167) TaxID=397948 RepID=A8MCH1_CALMQ|nr:polyprenyl synthetase family protein [Caldivirga maquilingensis]ABW01477.1 Polyprenyl synthetase [Caldivirga maquilingensis IC-167]
MVDVLSELHEKYGELVNKAIERYLTIGVDPSFRETVLYQVATGGKRIRPLMVIESALACGGSLESALPYAAIVELIHNYSLIYDDIIDEADLRRNMPTVRRKYGDYAAILVGIWYREAIEEAVLDTRNPSEVARVVAETIKAIDEGERLDILMEYSGRRDPYFIENRLVREITPALRDLYIRMISLKTAALFKTSMWLGGYSAKCGNEQLEALSNFGYNVGVAFQIIDDVLDIFGDLRKFGKEIGKDLKEHKVGNLVILLSLLESKEANKLLNVLSKQRPTQDDVKEAVEVISATKAREEAIRMANEYMSKAISELSKVPRNEHTMKLEELAKFIVYREY